jgi:hypothetical protein
LWIVAVLVLISLCPLLAVAGGVLLVYPARTSTSLMEPGPAASIAVQGSASNADALSGTVAPTISQPGAAPAAAGFRWPFSFGLAEILILAGLAGGAVLAGGMVFLVLAQRRNRKAGPEKGPTLLQNDEASRQDARIRYTVFAGLAGLALVLFVTFDLLGSASLYWRFVVFYAGFWVLVGVLVLPARPWVTKIIVLASLVAVLLWVRAIDWNSRKPFLRDLYSVDEGMTVEQVDRIMNEYMRSTGQDAVFDEEGRILAGTVTYRHTDEGWGDSDWGIVTLKDGRAVQIRFLPD